MYRLSYTSVSFEQPLEKSYRWFLPLRPQKEVTTHEKAINKLSELLLKVWERAQPLCDPLLLIVQK